ncbi:MAG: leader peptidase (prepilin peptidase) / N-methyltransferase [Miltoncostaeaceae bacterium]|jgi:leader peptidase (prepilin peptidase)/N-methyltransferase|nr:leader peptidase (prepilin peptidase) / N-methyltransferase [Miltoncostaeaceae bacterium]
MNALPLGYWVTVAGVLGLALGSFFTVLVHRWPTGQSLVSPRSHCTTCDRTLGPLDLIPVVSWLLARGRCRGCGDRVSWTYPAIELATAGLAAGAILSFGATPRGVAAAILGIALVPVVVIDMQHRLIPDVVVLPAALGALFVAAWADADQLTASALAAVGAGAFMFLLWAAYPGGMGLGDVKLAVLIGAVLGTSAVPALAIAFAAGAAIGVAMLVRHGSAARKMAVPFGPFLAAGAMLALWCGPAMIDWYSGRL